LLVGAKAAVCCRLASNACAACRSDVRRRSRRSDQAPCRCLSQRAPGCGSGSLRGSQMVSTRWALAAAGPGWFMGVWITSSATSAAAAPLSDRGGRVMVLSQPLPFGLVRWPGTGVSSVLKRPVVLCPQGRRCTQCTILAMRIGSANALLLRAGTRILC